MYNPNFDHNIILTSVASVYSRPNFNSELVTQALIWEKIIILDKKNNWLYVELQDGYIGWLHSFYAVDCKTYESNKNFTNKSNWFWVINKFANLKSNFDNEELIGFGSLIPCFSEDDFYTILPNNKKIVIDKKSVIKFGSFPTLEYIVNCSQKLIGIPYLWGGKSVFGYDCSGFLQAIMKIGGLSLPRDTKEQIKSEILKEINVNEVSIGDIIFFIKDDITVHVGMYIDNQVFIHSSGNVKYGSIIKDNKYYSEELKGLDCKLYRLKNVK